MEGLTLEQLKAKGAKPVTQDNGGMTLSQLQGGMATAASPQQQTQQPNFLQRVNQDIQQRGQNINTAFETPQNPISTGIQATGQTFAGIGDVIGEGIKSAYNTLGQPGHDAAIALIQSKVGQDALGAMKKGVDAYNQWKAQSPTHQQIGKDLEGAFNIVGNIFGAGAGGATAERAVPLAADLTKTGLKVGGKAIEASGQAAADTQRSSFIKDLITPPQTEKTALSEIKQGRVTESNPLLPLSKRQVAETPVDQAIHAAVTTVPEVKPGNTALQNSIAIHDAIASEAKSLEARVEAKNYPIPRQQTMAELKELKKELASEPDLVGDSAKTAQRLIDKFQEFLNKNTGDAKGFLKARKEYDAFVKSRKPKVFDAKSENAFTTVNRAIRDYANKTLHKNAPDADSQNSLARQAALYRANDVVAEKASQEARTSLGRVLQSVGKILHIKSTIVQAVGAASGFGILGASAVYAPAAATTFFGGLFLYKAGKLITSPQLRIGIGKLVQSIDKVIPEIKDPKILAQVKKDRQFLVTLATNPLAALKNPENMAPNKGSTMTQETQTTINQNKNIPGSVPPKPPEVNPELVSYLKLGERSAKKAGLGEDFKKLMDFLKGNGE